MSLLYKIISNGIYYAVWPYGRLRAGLGNKLWRGRLGLGVDVFPCDIWVHAASVGETKVAGYLIDYLIKHKRKIKIYLTTMTTAGQKIAEQIKSENVCSGYFPLDQAGAIKRTLKKINPRLLIIAETEIWPNLIEHTNKQNISIVLVNGRMSDNAFKKYRIISKTMSRLLSNYDKLFVKTESDKEKLCSFMVDKSKVTVAGDMKFDAPLLPRSQGRRQEIRGRLGAKDDHYIFVAGSTRPGEEVLLAQMAKRLESQKKKLKLVIAPRHLNRLDEIKSELSNSQTEYCTYGESNDSSMVILVEQMGALNDLYLAADMAFVGGTLVNIGGHNILEPVWCGCPVIFGPYTANVNEAKKYILHNSYGAMAENLEHLIEIVSKHINGQLTFRTKQSEDIEHSPTAMAGEYIIEKLSNV